jgi:hypothetical protein
MLNASSIFEFASVIGPLGGDADGPVRSNPTDADPENGTSDYAAILNMIAKRAFGRYARWLQ